MDPQRIDAGTASGPTRISRRAVAQSAGFGLAAASLGPVLHATAQEATPVAMQNVLAAEVIAAFDGLPGRKSLRFWAPAEAGYAEWSVTHNPGADLFCASAFKAYVLAEFLRQIEAGIDPDGETTPGDQLNAALAEQLVLDDTVFSPGAPIFNPPNLAGTVSARTTLEAMISHSDNTATDMALAQAGPDNVRAFIASIGLGETRIPESTRQFFGYVAGDPEWQTITWDSLMSLLTSPDPPPHPPRPIVNDEITMVSSPDDFVSFYSRALQGEFFRYPETLAVFRSILSLADAIAFAMPLGVSAFLKGGSIDFGADHALSIAGGMWIPQRWVYFSFLINWTDDEAGLVAEVQAPFVAAANTMFTLVRDRLGG